MELDPLQKKVLGQEATVRLRTKPEDRVPPDPPDPGWTPQPQFGNAQAASGSPVDTVQSDDMVTVSKQAVNVTVIAAGYVENDIITETMGGVIYGKINRWVPTAPVSINFGDIAKSGEDTSGVLADQTTATMTPDLVTGITPMEDAVGQANAIAASKKVTDNAFPDTQRLFAEDDACFNFDSYFGSASGKLNGAMDSIKGAFTITKDPTGTGDDSQLFVNIRDAMESLLQDIQNWTPTGATPEENSLDLLILLDDDMTTVNSNSQALSSLITQEGLDTEIEGIMTGANLEVTDQILGKLDGAGQRIGGEVQNLETMAAEGFNRAKAKGLEMFQKIPCAKNIMGDNGTDLTKVAAGDPDVSLPELAELPTITGATIEERYLLWIGRIDRDVLLQNIQERIENN